MDKVAEMPQWTSDVEVVASRKKTNFLLFLKIYLLLLANGVFGVVY